MTVLNHPAAATPAESAANQGRSTRLERALAEAMKVQEGPELLAKIASREFKDAFQAIAVQQRGYVVGGAQFEPSAVPTVQMNYDPDYPDDKSKQLYHCRIGAAVLTPESAKALHAMAAERGIRFFSTPKNEFSQSHWFKAIVISLYATDFKDIVALVNDALIDPVRPDARVTYDDVIRIAQEEIGKLFS
jgi:hypothetical protein